MKVELMHTPKDVIVQKFPKVFRQVSGAYFMFYRENRGGVLYYRWVIVAKGTSKLDVGASGADETNPYAHSNLTPLESTLTIEKVV